jgi:hypothetical protein
MVKVKIKTGGFGLRASVIRSSWIKGPNDADILSLELFINVFGRLKRGMRWNKNLREISICLLFEEMDYSAWHQRTKH